MEDSQCLSELTLSENRFLGGVSARFLVAFIIVYNGDLTVFIVLWVAFYLPIAPLIYLE